MEGPIKSVPNSQLYYSTDLSPFYLLLHHCCPRYTPCRALCVRGYQVGCLDGRDSWETTDDVTSQTHILHPPTLPMKLLLMKPLSIRWRHRGTWMVSLSLLQIKNGTMMQSFTNWLMGTPGLNDATKCLLPGLHSISNIPQNMLEAKNATVQAVLSLDMDQPGRVNEYSKISIHLLPHVDPP